MSINEFEEARYSYNIPEDNLAKFKKTFASLNNKSVKYGFGQITPVIFGYHMSKMPDGFMHKIFEVLIDTDIIKINGWNFIATINETDCGNIIYSVPKFKCEIPENYKHDPIHCDHCKINRYRKDAFVIHNSETNEFKMVGRTCLKDFFGIDPTNIAKKMEFLTKMGNLGHEYEHFNGEHTKYVSTIDYLTYCADIILSEGWVSRNKSNDTGMTPTNCLAINAMLSYAKILNKKSYELAEAAREWALTFVNKQNSSDYEHNIAVIAKNDYIEYRSLGFAASIVGCYYMNMSKISVNHKSCSEFVGTIGEKIGKNNDLIGTVICSKAMHHPYNGPYYIYKIEVNKNVFTTFTSSFKNVFDGDTVVISGTIKKHETNNNIKETYLTRARIKKVAN